MKVYIGRYPKDSTKERKVEVRIDPHDVWSLDSTLAYIIAPALKKIREDKQGAPRVDNEDVPDHLHRKVHTADDADELWFERWAYVLDEMIFAFDAVNTPWEDQFWVREPKFDFAERPEDAGEDFSPVRWLDSGECDWEARERFAERMKNGFRLFGKYYQNLWT